MQHQDRSTMGASLYVARRDPLASSLLDSFLATRHGICCLVFNRLPQRDTGLCPNEI